MQKVIVNLSFVIILSGCVQTRSPQPVAMKQPADASLTCDQIAVEYKANTEVAANKIKKNKANDTDDILLVLFVWPGLADFQNADGTEGNALLDRNIYLRELAKEKACGGITNWPAQPERYSYKYAGAKA